MLKETETEETIVFFVTFSHWQHVNWRGAWASLLTTAMNECVQDQNLLKA